MKSFARITTIALFAATGATGVCAQGGADSSNSKTGPVAASMQGWMTDYSKTNKGYISRQAYMDEMGRRWDAMDTSKQGLTTTQINSMYSTGPGPSPGMVKRQTNSTNPTGTELKGQNSGGK